MSDIQTNSQFNQRIQIIINPSARSGRGQAALFDRLKRDAALSAACVRSDSPQHFRALLCAAQAPQAGLLAVGIAGGDGTVTLALQALADCQQRVPLWVLPTGSGNDFANDLGGSRALPHALALLHQGIPRWVDVGEARTAAGSVQPFCCVASVGLDERALHHIHGSRLPRSQALNVYGALRGLWQYQPVAVEVSWSTGSFRGPISFLAVTNTRSYGGGFRISPRARIDDGRLDLCIVPQMPKAALLWRFPRILRGTHGDIPGVVQAQVDRVFIRACQEDRPLPVCLDGELPTLCTPVELRPAQRRLLVLSPRRLADRAAPPFGSHHKLEAA